MEHRMPVVASLGDASSNIGKAFMNGYNFKPFNTSMKMASVGGMLTSGIGGMAIGAGAGAIAGAGLAATSDMDPVAGAAVGGAVGAAAGAFAIPAVGLGFRALEGAAGGIMKAGAFVGKKAISGAFNGAIGTAAAGVGAVGLTMASSVVGAAHSIGSRMVRWDKTANTFMGMGEEANMIGKLTKSVGPKLTGPISGARMGFMKGVGEFKNAEGFFNKARAVGSTAERTLTGSVINGKGLLLGGALIEGAAKAYHEEQKLRMGQMDPGMTSIAPKTPYLDPAGATGDLVFAMNKNRRG